MSKVPITQAIEVFTLREYGGGTYEALILHQERQWKRQIPD